MNRSSLKILITGPGGSGKTTLADYFQSRGKNAVDADLAGIGSWLDQGGSEIEIPYDLDTYKINRWAEANDLTWHWRKDSLVELLQKYDEIFVMGSAKNAFSLASLFDRVYYLEAEEHLILERLKERAMSRNSYHDNGSTYEQRMVIIKKIKPKIREARIRGFEFIDASLTPEEIFNKITNP